MLEYLVIIITLVMLLVVLGPYLKYRKSIGIRKPVEHFHEEMRESKLNRVLTRSGLTALGVGAIIGAGIFVITGVVAKLHTGPALSLSFIVAGIGCTCAALCYAEFASMLPVEGSAYAYSYATMGEFFAWIIGWDLILEYAMAAATVAVGWSGYLIKFLNKFDIYLPLFITNDYKSALGLINEASMNGTLTEFSKHYSSIDIPMLFGIPIAFNLPAFLVIWAVTLVLIKGAKEAASTNTIMVVLKVAVVLFIIIVGAQYINTSNWHPFTPFAKLVSLPIIGSFNDFGIVSIFSGAGYVFFAYIGFDAVSTSAGEAKNPQKDVPFGIIVSLVICTVLYILVSLVLTGMVNYKNIDLNAPISTAFNSVGLAYAEYIISIAAIVGLTSVLIVMLLGQSRVFYAMSKDGLLPKNPFGDLHPKFKTPYKTSLLTGLVVSFVAALTPIDSIAKLVNIGTLLAFVMVCGAVWLMRKKDPSRERPFRTPWLPFVATTGILFSAGMMFSLGRENWERLFFWLALGTLIYFFYSRKHSVLQAKQTK